jgi:hypothetical protein
MTGPGWSQAGEAQFSVFKRKLPTFCQPSRTAGKVDGGFNGRRDERKIGDFDEFRSDPIQAANSTEG